MTISCAHCGSPVEMCRYQEFMSDGRLCSTCARREILGWLADCDDDELDILKNRAI